MGVQPGSYPLPRNGGEVSRRSRDGEGVFFNYTR
jgi:hypothetical protein